MTRLSSEKRLRDAAPAGVLRSLAENWLAGHSFSLFLRLDH